LFVNFIEKSNNMHALMLLWSILFVLLLRNLKFIYSLTTNVIRKQQMTRIGCTKHRIGMVCRELLAVCSNL